MGAVQGAHLDLARVLRREPPPAPITVCPCRQRLRCVFGDDGVLDTGQDLFGFADRQAHRRRSEVATVDFVDIDQLTDTGGFIVVVVDADLDNDSHDGTSNFDQRSDIADNRRFASVGSKTVPPQPHPQRRHTLDIDIDIDVIVGFGPGLHRVRDHVEDVHEAVGVLPRQEPVDAANPPRRTLDRVLVS